MTKVVISIDLQSKSMDWVLYDNDMDLHHEKVSFRLDYFARRLFEVSNNKNNQIIL